MCYFKFASYRQQNFRFPTNVINFIGQNPTNADFWKKLVKTCKFFFDKNPIIVSDRRAVYFRDDSDGGHIEILGSNGYSRIGIKHLIAKIWLNGTLCSYGGIGDLIQVIYKSQLKKITFIPGATVRISDLRAIAHHVELLDCGNRVEFVDDADNLMSYDDVIAELVEYEFFQSAIFQNVYDD